MMKKIGNPSLNKIFFLSLSISFISHLCAVWFSEGRAHPDEHYQILEFAQYKISGGIDLTLPWEFFEKIRPTIQPAIVYLVHSNVPGSDPFSTTLVLRSISALLGFLSIWIISIYGIRWFSFNWQILVIILISGFFWLYPFLHARFSSENWSGIFLLFGILLAHRACSNEFQYRGICAYFSGFTLGLAFFCRFPVGFAVAGLFLWVILISRPPLKLTAIIFLGFILAICMNIAIDTWFYGDFQLTPVNYFIANIIDGKAAEFGVDPWWYYIEKLFFLLVPPISLLMLPIVIMAVLIRPRNILTWIVMAFLIGHSIIAHKETRFLMPIIPLIIILCVMVTGDIAKKIKIKKIFYKILLWPSIVVNCLMLIYLCFAPASQATVIHKWIYKQASFSPAQIAVLGDDPYSNHPGIISFLKSNNVEFVNIEEGNYFDLLSNEENDSFYVFSKSTYPNEALVTMCEDLDVTHSALPDWVRYLDRNKWLSDAKIWGIFRCNPVKTKIN